MGNDKFLSVAEIVEMLDSSYWRNRYKAMVVCVGRSDIDPKLIEMGLGDEEYFVIRSAYKALKKSGYEIPLKRTFEPPTTVYKKCRNDVIVCATIPDNAQVRGKDGYKCRASAAVITDVVGIMDDEKVGVSRHNSTIKYHIGDTIEIDDFDYSDEECSTGFHFFCTLKEAEHY